MLYEEPTLRGKFGEDYSEYCRNVPRFIPRLTPWQSRDEIAESTHALLKGPFHPYNAEINFC